MKWRANVYYVIALVLKPMLQRAMKMEILLVNSLQSHHREYAQFLPCLLYQLNADSILSNLPSTQQLPWIGIAPLLC